MDEPKMDGYTSVPCAGGAIRMRLGEDGDYERGGKPLIDYIVYAEGEDGRPEMAAVVWGGVAIGDEDAPAVAFDGFELSADPDERPLLWNLWNEAIAHEAEWSA